MNQKGMKFVEERTRPLAVATMDRAAEVIGKELAKRDERAKAGRPLETDVPEKFGTHLAWIVGMDALLEDRAAIHNVVEKVA
jgi:hypothetical protein